MLTIFRTHPKDRDNRSNETDQQPVEPVETTFRPTQMPPPTIQPPKPLVQNLQGPPLNASHGSTTIGKDLVFEGNVQGSGSIRVEGDFKGTLEVQNEVIIGKGGTVTGDIKADIVTVEGDLKGNVEARQKISINVTGTMMGDIIAPRVVVASGAVYKGRIDMETALKKQQDTANAKKQEALKSSPVDIKKPQEPAIQHQKPPESPRPIPGPPPQK